MILYPPASRIPPMAKKNVVPVVPQADALTAELAAAHTKAADADPETAKALFGAAMAWSRERLASSEPPLFWAIRTQNMGALETFLALGLDPNATWTDQLAGSSIPAGALGAASAHGDTHAMRTLLARSATPDGLSNQYAPLALASMCQHFDAAKLLLDKGADPNLSRKGSTALVHCALRGTPAIANLLIERGADPSFRDINGRNLFVLWAAGCAEPTFNMARLLTQAGCDPNEIDEPTGHTPLLLLLTGTKNRSAHFGRLARQLCSLGADPSKPNRHGISPIAYARNKNDIATADWLAIHATLS